MSTENLGGLYRRWLFEVWYGDFGVAEEIFAPDFVGHWPDRDVRGPDGVVEQIRMSREVFADIENTIDIGPIVEGGLVAAHWTFHGAYLGGIPGARAEAGTLIALHGSDVLRARDGLFVEYWTVSDGMSFLRQLDALPGSPSS